MVIPFRARPLCIKKTGIITTVGVKKGFRMLKATCGFIALLLLVNRLLLYEHLIRTLHTHNLKVARQTFLLSSYTLQWVLNHKKSIMKDKIYII